MILFQLQCPSVYLSVVLFVIEKGGEGRGGAEVFFPGVGMGVGVGKA